MTEAMLIDLMGDIDVALLNDDYMERDIARMDKPLAWEARAEFRGKISNGVDRVKKRARAAVTLAYGLLTMAVVAISFIALLGKRGKTV